MFANLNFIYYRANFKEAGVLDGFETAEFFEYLTELPNFLYEDCSKNANHKTKIRLFFRNLENLSVRIS